MVSEGILMAFKKIGRSPVTSMCGAEAYCNALGGVPAWKVFGLKKNLSDFDCYSDGGVSTGVQLPIESLMGLNPDTLTAIATKLTLKNGIPIDSGGKELLLTPQQKIVLEQTKEITQELVAETSSRNEQLASSGKSATNMLPILLGIGLIFLLKR